MSTPVVGLGLLDNRGIRYRPIGQESQEHLHSTALLPIAGRPIVEWVLRDLRRQGIQECFLGASNAADLARVGACLGDGSRLGVRIESAALLWDAVAFAVGSGRLTLGSLERWKPTGPVLVFPADTLFRFDLAAMVRAHDERGSMVTMAAVHRRPFEVPGYGTFRADRTGRVKAVFARPTSASLRARRDSRLYRGSNADDRPDGATDPTVLVSAGLYLVDSAALRLLAAELGPAAGIASPMAWEADLLPWLLRRGRRVDTHVIGGFGAVDTPRAYLETVESVLRGGLSAVGPALDGYVELAGRRWVHESTLEKRDAISGRTLRQKLLDGSVSLGPHIRIGHEVRVSPGVRLSDADVGDGSELAQNCTLERVVCGERSLIGPYAMLQDCCVGSGVDVQSSRRSPTAVGGYSVLGDEVCVHEGARIQRVCVYPNLTIRADVLLPEGARVTSASMLRGLGLRTTDIPWPA